MSARVSTKPSRKFQQSVDWHTSSAPDGKSVGFHSVFDCVIGSAVLINQAGKAVSGGTTKRDKETLVGGSPPVLHDITTAADKVDSFVTALFSNDCSCSKKWCHSVRRLLTASLLRFYSAMTSSTLSWTIQAAHLNALINIHSHSRQTKPRDWHHALTRRHGRRVGARKCNKVLCRGTFLLPCRPIQLIPKEKTETFLDNLHFDLHCFVDHFNALTSAHCSLHSQHLIQAREMKDPRRNFAALARHNERMEEQLIESNKHIKRIRNRIEVMTPTKKKSDNDPTEGVIPLYSVTISRWRKT